MDQHTGIHISQRPCPRHEAPLELVISEREYGTPIHWWCGSCHGLWSEEFFFFKAEATLPIRRADELLEIRCPDCGGRKFGNDCHPTCCSTYGCADCDKKFYLHLHMVISGREPSPEAPGTVRLETSPYDARLHPETDSTRKIVVLGHTASLRTCDWHDPAEAPHLMELLHFPEILDERFRFGWRCPQLGRISMEYLLPLNKPCSQCWPYYHWPRMRDFFAGEQEPQLYCLLCGGLEFCNAPEPGHYKCLSCESVYRLEVEAAEGSENAWWTPTATK